MVARPTPLELVAATVAVALAGIPVAAQPAAPEPSGIEAAAHLGLSTPDIVGDAHPGYGAGFVVGAEVGARMNRWISLVAFCDLTQWSHGPEPLSSTVSTIPGPITLAETMVAFDFGVRLRVHLGHVFAGLGAGASQVRTSGKECTDANYACADPTVPYSYSSTSFLADVHVGVDFPIRRSGIQIVVSANTRQSAQIAVGFRFR